MSDDRIEVVIVNTGVANMASLRVALCRAGATPIVTCDREAVEAADAVVLPGVGAFGPAMERLREDILVDALCERIAANRLTLAVCLGMQLLCRTSEESPGADGLGVLECSVRRFRGAVRVPHIGWNRVEPQASCRVVTPGYAYFANSYCLTEAPVGWSAASTVHGVSSKGFVSALERGNVLACQFHPELSGAWGSDLFKSWLGRRAPGGEGMMEGKAAC